MQQLDTSAREPAGEDTPIELVKTPSTPAAHGRLGPPALRRVRPNPNVVNHGQQNRPRLHPRLAGSLRRVVRGARSTGRLGKVDRPRPVGDDRERDARPRPSGAAWRLDTAILKDDMSTQRIKTRLEETITATPRVTPAAWDSLKAAWKTLLQQEGSARKRRITTKMNELLRRMRIVQSAEVLKTCTRDYLDSLQIQYDGCFARPHAKPVRREPPRWNHRRSICARSAATAR
ncbi:hypothetical protein MTO96_047003 [Rhipicephalus appendiculatus]